MSRADPIPILKNQTRLFPVRWNAVLGDCLFFILALLRPLVSSLRFAEWNPQYL